MNIANLLSISRVIVLPILIYCISLGTASGSVWALALMVYAVFSDIFDGVWRRKTSPVGSFLDPFADKVLIIGLLLLYTYRGLFWLTPLLIFIGRDLIVAWVRRRAARDTITLTHWDSHKTMIYFQYSIVIGLLLDDMFVYNQMLHLTLFSDVIFVIGTVAAVILSILSTLHYSSVYVHKLRSRRREGRKLEQEKMVVLANKRSRGYKSRYRRRLLKKFVKVRGCPIQYLPNSKDMYKGVAKKVGNAEQVMIAGGDGSFESALNYKPFWNKSLGFFPLGAGNAFYSYFYKGKKFEYVRSRFPFHEVELDVLEIAWDNQKMQTTFMSVGIDAEVMRLSKDDRSQYGLFDYVKASVKATLRSKAHFDLRVKVGRVTKKLDNCVNFTLAKVPFYGFGIRSLLGDVKPNDGYVYGLGVANAHSLLLNKGVRVWALVLAIFGMEKAPLFSLKGKSFIVESDEPFPLQAGGEFVGHTKKVSVKVVRKQKVLVI